MLEQVSHLEVVDPVGMKIDIGHCLDDGEETIAGVELLDLIGEVETLEDASCVQGKAVDVGNQVRRDVLRIAQQSGKSVGARVVERMLPTEGQRPCRAAVPLPLPASAAPLACHRGA